MVKETAASYKLDFKYVFTDGILKDKSYTLRSFARQSRWHEHYSDFDYDLFRALGVEYRNLSKAANCDLVDKSSELKEVKVAFDKWLNRREPIINAWNDYLEYQNSGVLPTYSYDRDKYAQAVGTPISLEMLAYVCDNRAYRRFLETSRPYKLPIGSAVELTEKYVNNWRYDPFYWGENRKSPRVGTLVKYDSEISGKGGTGSRMVQVMFFADGSLKKIPERCLQLYNANPTPKE